MDITLIEPGQKWWPFAQDPIMKHPSRLWCLGDLTLLHRPAISIVGARASTMYGNHVAGELAGHLAGEGTVVVSGMAYGIDAAAHRAALAVDGPTIAVLAGGVDKPYPSAHAALAEQIVDKGGLIISEQEPGSVPTRQRFLDRNRIIAELGDALVVVEASTRSGTLNAARHAIEYSNPVWAVPGAITSMVSSGSNELLNDPHVRALTSTTVTHDDLATWF